MASLIAGLAAMSPSPIASGWLPVQNVTPPSEATNTNRPCAAKLRAVQGPITSSDPIASTATGTQRRFNTHHGPASSRKNNIDGRINTATPAQMPVTSDRRIRSRVFGAWCARSNNQVTKSPAARRFASLNA